MLQAVSGEIAFQNERRLGRNHSGREQYQTYFIGKRYAFTPPDMPAVLKEVKEGVECHVSELGPNQTIRPHFHHTDQFQIMAAGSATHEGKALPLITLHYGDRYTVFGNLTTGAEGLCLFTMCNQADPGGVWMDQQGATNLLKSSKRRSLMAQNISLSTQGVLQNRKEIALESLFEKNVDLSDGLGAYIVRMGAGAKTAGPDPKLTGGQFYFIINGSLKHSAQSYSAWSIIYADHTEAPVELCAGPRGAEALIMNFPRLDAALG